MTSQAKGEKKYLIFDPRAMTDLDSATVLSTADTLQEAREDARMFGGGVIYQDIQGKNVTDEDFIESVNP